MQQSCMRGGLTISKTGQYMWGPYLDLVPKGRDEDELGFPMEWIRYHDRYGTDEFADANKPYWPPTGSAEASSTGCGCGTGEGHS